MAGNLLNVIRWYQERLRAQHDLSFLFPTRSFCSHGVLLLTRPSAAHPGLSKWPCRRVVAPTSVWYSLRWRSLDCGLFALQPHIQAVVVLWHGHATCPLCCSGDVVVMMPLREMMTATVLVEGRCPFPSAGAVSFIIALWWQRSSMLMNGRPVMSKSDLARLLPSFQWRDVEAQNMAGQRSGRFRPCCPVPWIETKAPRGRWIAGPFLSSRLSAEDPSSPSDVR